MSRAAVHFAGELDRLIERTRFEYTLTYAEAIGVMELVKADLIQESRIDDEEDE